MAVQQDIKIRTSYDPGISTSGYNFKIIESSISKRYFAHSFTVKNNSNVHQPMNG